MRDDGTLVQGADCWKQGRARGNLFVPLPMMKVSRGA